MILCPIQNKAIKQADWVQLRPAITQVFGDNPMTYEQFGLLGHNGVDLRASVGTPVFASFDGKVKVKNSGKEGYGLHVRIRGLDREITLGHLSSVTVLDGQYVKLGKLIGYTGNTGFSTGAHLHVGLRQIEKTGKKDIFLEKVVNYNNGYYGAYDPTPYLITWKGTLKEWSL